MKIMAQKISVRLVGVIFLIYAVAIALCACMNPTDVDSFLGSKQVDDIIQSTKVAVKVSSDSDGGLTGGNRIISGLDPAKYYMVTQELDDKDTPINTTSYPKFVSEYSPSAKGQLFKDLGVITRITGRTITTLTNKHTYTVKSATQIISGTITYNDGSGSASKTITGGVLTIDKINGTGKLNLSGSGIISGTYSNETIMAVSVDDPTTSPWSWKARPNASDTIDLSAFEIEKSGTVDYVFYKSATDFKVLRVVGPATINIKAIPGVTKPETGKAPVTTITETTQYTGTVSWSGSPATFAPLTAYTATITLSPKTGYTLYGVQPNFFTVEGATSVTYSAGSNTVVAVFPPTSAVTTVNITISFTVSNDSITPSISGDIDSPPITYKNILDGKTILTFTLASGISGVTWEMEGVSIPEGTDEKLVIDDSSSLLPYLVTGKHILSVKGTGIGGSYSQTITFTVD